MNLQWMGINNVIYIHPLYQSLWLNNSTISNKMIKDF
jgi:hypothetical protein